MTGPARVLVLAPDPAVIPGNRQGDAEFHVCADLADLLGRAGAGAADAALLSPRVAGVDAVAVRRLRALGCRPLALADGPTDIELAGRIGLTDCLAPPIDAALLRAALTTEHPAAAAGSSPRDGRILAVWGPPGSPGRSLVTALLAVGAQRAGLRVVIVDADLAAPQWGLLSEQDHVAGLIVAARRWAAGAADVSDLLQPLAPGIALLPFTAEPERWIEVLPEAGAGVLDAAAACADVVLVDMPCDIRSAHPAYDIGWAHDTGALARTVLASCDQLLAVLSAEPLGVHRFASWWPVLRNQRQPALIIANRVGAPRGGRRPGEQLAAVLQELDCDSPMAEVPWHPKAADALLGPGWASAAGWRRVPETLWAAVGAAQPLSRATAGSVSG